MATKPDCGRHDAINSERYGFYVEARINTNKCRRSAIEWASVRRRLVIEFMCVAKKMSI